MKDFLEGLKIIGKLIVECFIIGFSVLGVKSWIDTLEEWVWETEE